jgi:hypothetical protein
MPTRVWFREGTADALNEVIAISSRTEVGWVPGGMTPVTSRPG